MLLRAYPNIYYRTFIFGRNAKRPLPRSFLLQSKIVFPHAYPLADVGCYAVMAQPTLGASSAVADSPVQFFLVFLCASVVRSELFEHKKRTGLAGSKRVWTECGNIKLLDAESFYRFFD